MRNNLSSNFLQFFYLRKFNRVLQNICKISMWSNFIHELNPLSTFHNNPLLCHSLPTNPSSLFAIIFRYLNQFWIIELWIQHYFTSIPCNENSLKKIITSSFYCFFLFSGHHFRISYHDYYDHCSSRFNIIFVTIK